MCGPSYDPYPCSTVPLAVPGGPRYSDIVAGGFSTCALTSGGEAHCWGANWNGILGIGSTEDNVWSPAAVMGGLRFVELAAGQRHICGLTREGELYCWGDNDFGQLGDGTREPRAAPVRVPAPAIQLAGGG